MEYKIVNGVIVGDSGPSVGGWSQEAVYMACPKEYQFSAVRQIHHVQSQTSDALAIGSLVHAGRARWFTCGFGANPETWDKVVEAVNEECSKFTRPISKEAKEKALNYLEQFIRFWASRPLPTPIATEHLLGPAPFERGDPTPLWRTSKPDDISRYPEGGSELWLGDLKTTSGDVAACIREYELHGQFLQMMALYKTAPQGEKLLGPAAGIMLDIVQKPPYGGEGQCKFARHPIIITDYSLKWAIKNIKKTIRGMAQVSWDSDEDRNLKSCTRMIGRYRADCMYKNMCRFGKSAAGEFVYGEEDNSLLTFEPSEGKKTLPWL
jgi:hypothetical protein